MMVGKTRVVVVKIPDNGYILKVVSTDILLGSMAKRKQSKEGLSDCSRVASNKMAETRTVQV